MCCKSGNKILEFLAAGLLFIASIIGLNNNKKSCVYFIFTSVTI